ncbi:hypothetical protein V502_08206 [Pseudogymnoascus sp. VKM F-4520 (FW-2644)]|nr:hypothetical protein V502_08206 [Pseudogymnoascus sp. VKM F-4520 (FW-2644)]
MHFPTALSLVVTAAGFAAATPLEGLAAPRVNAATVQQSGGFKDMILTEIHTKTLAAANATADNRQISFHLSDPNFNTSTTCATTWLDSPNATTLPSSYIPCAANPGVKESYRWFFDSYTGLGEFGLQLAHAYSDPDNYPAPWDVVGLFATANVTLSCKEGGAECKLGEGESVRTPINAAVN